jgi:hypothetical protein
MEDIDFKDIEQELHDEWGEDYVYSEPEDISIENMEDL